MSFRRPVPLRMSWRLDALNKLVADAQKVREMNLGTRGKAEIDRRSVLIVDAFIERLIADVQRVRDGVAEDVRAIETDDDDLAVLVERSS